MFLSDNFGWFQSGRKPMGESDSKFGVACFLEKVGYKLKLLVAFIVKFGVLVYLLEPK
jgi:hypothetical protein